MENISTVIPAVLIIIAVVCISLYPMTRKRVALLNDALSKKRNGEEYSTEGLERLL